MLAASGSLGATWTIPPFSIAVLAATRALLGDSVAAIRLPASWPGGLLVLLVGSLARQMGGGRFAQGIAGLTVLATGIILALDSFFSMNAFDLVFWAACAWLFAVRVEREEPRLWIALGVVAGLGLQ